MPICSPSLGTVHVIPGELQITPQHPRLPWGTPNQHSDAALGINQERSTHPHEHLKAFTLLSMLPPPCRCSLGSSGTGPGTRCGVGCCCRPPCCWCCRTWSTRSATAKLPRCAAGAAACPACCAVLCVACRGVPCFAVACVAVCSVALVSCRAMPRAGAAPPCTSSGLRVAGVEFGGSFLLAGFWALERPHLDCSHPVLRNVTCPQTWSQSQQREVSGQLTNCAHR
jgi:hypothetical protein